jgi:hypothetical protein
MVMAVMARHHRSVVTAVHARTAWHLPLLGSALAVFGLILLVAGLMAIASPPVSTAVHGLQIEGVVPMLRGSPPLATRAPRLLQTTWFPSAQFAIAPRHSRQVFAGGERISSSTAPLEKRDPRRTLLAMAAAQHTGHWIYACPCPTRQFSSPVEPYDTPTSGPR